MSPAEGQLLAGQIGKPHGLAGEVYVVRISDDPKRFEPGSRLFHEDGRELVVERARVHRSRFLVKFEGVEAREGAETLRGALYINSEDRRTLAEDEFWQDDLVGCDLVDADGRSLGRVDAVQPAPAHDLLVVATERGERLVPVVKEMLVNVDVDERRITVDLPEGLLD